MASSSIWMEVVLLTVALISLTAVVAVAALTVRQRHFMRDVDERMRLLRLDVNSMSSGSVGVGKRLQEVEKKLLQKKERTASAPDQGYAPYSQATQLLDTGANIDDIVRDCGITRAEAELMGLMHRQMKRRGSHPW